VRELLVLVTCAALAVPLSVGIRALALRRDLLDRPNERSSHTVPTPRGGGLAFVVVVSLAVLAVVAREPEGGRLALALLVAGLPVAVIGFVDDVRSVSPAVRAAVHAAAALAAVLLLGVPGGVTGGAAVAVGAACVLGLVWLVNLWNFMDGIDGLAGGQALVAAVGLAVLASGASAVSLAAAALAGAVLGFLALNRPPARLFMGDVGSGFLGLALGVLALGAERSADVPMAAAALLVAPFLVDATATLLDRIVRGERWYAAHRDHLYQRLVQRGASHGTVTSAYVGLSAVLALVALLLADRPGVVTAVAVLTLVGLLGVWVALRSVGRETVPPSG
jgi:Fuc2NAc and GlcNAc transferase